MLCTPVANRKISPFGSRFNPGGTGGTEIRREESKANNRSLFVAAATLPANMYNRFPSGENLNDPGAAPSNSGMEKSVRG